MGKTTHFFLVLYAHKDLPPMGICKTSFLVLTLESLADPPHTPSQVSVAYDYSWQHMIILLNYMFLIAGLTMATLASFNFSIFPFAPLIFILLHLLRVLPDPFHLRIFKELQLSSLPEYFF